MITYIIDGYNVLHRLEPELLAAGELAAARRELEARLRSFLGSRGRGVRLVLIYDGDDVGRPSRSSRERLEIVFSRPPRKADDLILDRCREPRGRGDVRVVTSDWKDIGGPVRPLGVHHVSSEDFIRYIESPSTADLESQSVEKPEGSDRGEVGEWLEAFGFPRDED